ncbi:MAG: DUF2520 domain-containing protein [Eubacterium sp.]|nr:DUF2520 domain-containing protein [Eubacterium sp.]
MKIGIIGAGKVGCSMGKYFVENGIPVAGFYSRHQESAEQAATFTKTEKFDSLTSLVDLCDMVFIATPDDAIREVWNRIHSLSIENKVICHFSGSLSSDVFSRREQTGALCCSLHPMYAFSDRFTSYEKLNTVIFSIEGDKQGIVRLRELFLPLGNSVYKIASDKKVKYHCAASMVSNMMIGLYELSIRMLEDCGLDQEQARLFVEPLVRGNIENVLNTSSAEALSGPIERGDLETVKKHLMVLRGREKRIYQDLGQIVLQIAEEKNPDRDYAELEELISAVSTEME